MALSWSKEEEETVEGYEGKRRAKRIYNRKRSKRK